MQVRGFVTVAEPYSGCSEIVNAEYIQGHIALLQRGQCMFAEKARHIQKAGAIGGIVIGEREQQMTAQWLDNLIISKTASPVISAHSIVIKQQSNTFLTRFPNKKFFLCFI